MMIQEPISFITNVLGKTLDFNNSKLIYRHQILNKISSIKYVPIKMSITATDCIIQRSDNRFYTGIYVPPISKKVGIGILNGYNGFFCSDKFGGCDFALLRTPDGKLAAAHIYSSSECRDFINGLNEPWECIHVWRSSPYAKKFGVLAGLFCFMFINNKNVEFIVVSLSGFPAKINHVVRSSRFPIE